MFLANVNSRSRSLYAIARPSVVCNVRAPYSGGLNIFYGIWCLGHLLTSIESFTAIVPGNPSAGGVKHKRESNIAILDLSNCYISETVQEVGYY